MTSCMTVTMTDHRTPSSSTARPATRSEGRVRWALVADRNPLLREGLRLYLETLGWRTVAAGTVDEGLKLLVPTTIPSPKIVPDLIVLGEAEHRGAATPWQSVLDRLAAIRGTARPVLLSIAASNHDLMLRARDRGFDTIHIDLAPLNLDVLLLDCVRRIEGGRS